MSLTDNCETNPVWCDWSWSTETSTHSLLSVPLQMDPDFFPFVLRFCFLAVPNIYDTQRGTSSFRIKIMLVTYSTNFSEKVGQMHVGFFEVSNRQFPIFSKNRYHNSYWFRLMSCVSFKSDCIRRNSIFIKYKNGAYFKIPIILKRCRCNHTVFQIRPRKDCPLECLWKFANFSKIDTRGLIHI